MFLCAYLDLLAQLPESNTYVNPVKLGAIVAVFAVWAYFAQWMDKDTIAVNTYREIWNLIGVLGGVTALAFGLFVPSFLIGFLLMAAVNLALILAYVLHRNGLVKPEDTVCTAAHIRRMKEQGVFGKKKKVKEVKERVRLTGADRKVVVIPEDENERERYRLTQDLVFDLLWRRASQAEVTPAGQDSKITYLIDGIATEREGLVRAEGDGIVQFLKGVAGLNLEERRKPQRGKIMAAIGENKYDVFVETAGSTAGERLRLRLVGLEGSAKVEDLGFSAQQLESVREVMNRPHGLVLLTAPAASGGTTTIYSLVRSHDAFLQNIQMLEYDQEVEVNNVTQRLYTPADDKTFASEMQRMVRADPDMLVFPEIREREAAALACRAASEKIKAYVGMVAEDVFDALRKWIALVGDKALVARSLWMVTNQRLVRRLCANCKQPYRPDPGMLKKLNLPPDAVLHRQPEPEYDKHGNPIVCQACQGTGYVGRTGVFDALLVDDGLRRVISSAASLGEVQNHALKKGGRGLQAQAIQKVLEGTTSMPEILRVIRGRGGRPRGSGAGPRPRPKPKSAAGPQTGRQRA